MFFILGRLIALTFCVCSLFEHECNAFDLHVWLLKFCLEHACDVTHTCIWINPKREINQTIEQKRGFFFSKNVHLSCGSAGQFGQSNYCFTTLLL